MTIGEPWHAGVATHRWELIDAWSMINRPFTLRAGRDGFDPTAGKHHEGRFIIQGPSFIFTSTSLANERDDGGASS